jgi:hypothetical protein
LEEKTGLKDKNLKQKNNKIMKNIFIALASMLFFTTVAYAQPTCNSTIEKGKEIVLDLETITPTSPPSGPTTPPPGPNDERIVYWVHGLGGSSGAWAKAASASTNEEWDVEDIFWARELKSITPEYNEDGDLLIAADQLRGAINDVAINQQALGDADPNDNFIIAHSQGGLVSSALMYKDFSSQPLPEEQRFYGGIVTVCSPMQGARILNNVDDLLVMSGEGCTALLAGPKEEAINNTTFKIINLFVNADEIVETLVADACGFIEEMVVPKLFAGNLAPTTANYSVGAEPINWFNNTSTPDIDRVAFYGVEEKENLMWRTMEYMSKSPNGDDFGYWGANNDFDDDGVWGFASKTTLKYQNKYQKYTNELAFLEAHPPCANGWELANWLWPGNWTECIIKLALHNGKKKAAKKKKWAWHKGKNWLNSASDQYRKHIGALNLEPQESVQCNCVKGTSFGDSYLVTYEGPCMPQFECNIYSYESTVYTNQWTSKPSDGVVLAESAMDVNGDNETYGPQLLLSSSHMQARNNDAIRDKLTQLYDGAFGMFFYTEKRNP